jgi:4-alpha-glucanotransferase
LERARLNTRSSGVLLHPTSLPGLYDLGDIGKEAKRFARFLHDAGQRWWQMCPLNPPLDGRSPYQAISSFAGNPGLINVDELVTEGLLLRAEIPARSSKTPANFDTFQTFKLRCLDAVFARFRTREQSEFLAFKEKNKYWLEDYALFCALRKHYGKKAWTEWPAALRRREQKTLEQVKPHLAASCQFFEFVQFVFFRQLASLKAACAENGVGLLGDTAIYVAHDSADVWAHQSFFDLDAKGKPNSFGGTPPDLFSKEGQNWNMPTYRWPEMRKDGYQWWIERFKIAFDTFDAVRLDHFIGYVRYWRIPAAGKTGLNGEWVPGPQDDFFETVLRALPNAQFVAEDLGDVAEDVENMRDRFRLPGMKVLQFAFADDPAARTFLPENHRKADVVYTGTHDNDTSVGWHKNLVDAARRDPSHRAALDLLMKYVRSGDDIHWKMIELAMNSKADVAIIPFQDVLGLDSSARLNNPYNQDANWKWRFQWEQLSPAITQKLKQLTDRGNRLEEPLAAAHS